MRADICESADTAAITRLKAVLESFGAVLLKRHESALGVDLYEFSVGGERLRVFTDALSVDVEGPELVRRMVAACHQTDVRSDDRL